MMTALKPWLDGSAAMFAFGAAGFWFWSAYGKVPALVAYWGAAPATDPFYASIVKAAALNKYAAIAAGMSALCTGSSWLAGLGQR